MAVRLDRWVRSLCQETIYANTDFVLAQRNTFMSLLQQEYHNYFLGDDSFMNIENIQFSFHLSLKKAPLWKRIWPISLIIKKDRPVFEICPPSKEGAMLCEISIKREGKLFEEEIKIDGKKVENKEIYVEEA